MIACEWILNNEDYCTREATFTIMLKGSNSASNLHFVCWQHVKKYRERKFIQDTFGKNAKVEILRLGGSGS